MGWLQGRDSIGTAGRYFLDFQWLLRDGLAPSGAQRMGGWPNDPRAGPGIRANDRQLLTIAAGIDFSFGATNLAVPG